mgnify:CR=1 FL=1
MKEVIKKFRLPVNEGCKKMKAKYVNISITEDLAKKIDEHLEKAKEGYRSRAEFISEAIRQRLGIIKSKKNKI